MTSHEDQERSRNQAFYDLVAYSEELGLYDEDVDRDEVVRICRDARKHVADKRRREKEQEGTNT